MCVCRVTLDKRTSERYNFASTSAIELYLGKHIISVQIDCR